MPTQAQLTKLDTPAINAFINGPLTEFLAVIEELGKDSGTALSPRNIARGYTNPDTFSLTKPLAIGLMSGGDTVHGSTLNSTTLKFTQSIDTMLQNMTNLSQEIKDTLLKMVEEFLKKQGGTLDDIKAQEFLNTIKSAGSPTNDPTKTSTDPTKTGT
ncbi:type VII secretion system-associated protein [Streptomyces sp. NBC_00841]|uniref:type VII secretion system-associated protein n=1 Tax=unclassified Streptomyces TaxID=2593676 RepID=UPI00225509D6|nr:MULTISPECIES: type VII secretion system-associated protein [unclassified Streptomyces]MCX4536926.1 type VII secretion system-associated protein [Streptomyces sp. NBC_01669]WRZ97822.1 type VII secretion system-associated protein [Streptomyces sp. NBC_00841]